MNITESHIVPVVSEKIRLQEYAIPLFKTITTRSAVKKAIKKGLILIDGQPASTGDWIKEGQKIDLLQPDISDNQVFKLKLEVLYEDDSLAVVVKPPGFATSGNYAKTIQNALPYNLKTSEEADHLELPLPAHRLDSPTSGILLCAKTKSSLIHLQHQFSEKKISKEYTALVNGNITLPFEADDLVDSKKSRTQITPIKVYEIDGTRYTLVKAIPLTGRTHQIRIHLSCNGHPIVGDKLYGGNEHKLFRKKTLFLFASAIEFEHPKTSKTLKFQTILPKRLRNLDRFVLP